MDALNGSHEQVYRSRVDASGRIVLPAEVRLREQIQAGDQVMLVASKQGLYVKTLDQTIQDAQASFASLASADVVLSAELINDRRVEALHE